MRLKQICNHPAHWLGEGAWDEADSGKLARLREIVEPVAGQAGEGCCASPSSARRPSRWRRSSAELFGRPGLVLHGSTPVRARGGLVKRFQEDDRQYRSSCSR